MFKEIGLTLLLAKSFLSYLSVQLLGYRVDGLGMSTTEERVEAIKNLLFPRTLKELETFIGITGFLRQYVPFYAKAIELL